MTNITEVISGATATFDSIMVLVVTVTVFIVAVGLIRRFLAGESASYEGWYDNEDGTDAHVDQLTARQMADDGLVEGWVGYTSSERMAEMGWDEYDEAGTWDHEDSV